MCSIDASGKRRSELMIDKEAILFRIELSGGRIFNADNATQIRDTGVRAKE
jgi:hypothetical protein